MCPATFWETAGSIDAPLLPSPSESPQQYPTGEPGRLATSANPRVSLPSLVALPAVQLQHTGLQVKGSCSSPARHEPPWLCQAAQGLPPRPPASTRATS